MGTICSGYNIKVGISPQFDELRRFSMPNGIPSTGDMAPINTTTTPTSLMQEEAFVHDRIMHPIDGMGKAELAAVLDRRMRELCEGSGPSRLLEHKAKRSRHFHFDPASKLDDAGKEAVRALQASGMQFAPCLLLARTARTATELLAALWPNLQLTPTSLVLSGQEWTFLKVVALLAWLCTVSPSVMSLLALAPVRPGQQLHAVNLLLAPIKYTIKKDAGPQAAAQLRMLKRSVEFGTDMIIKHVLPISREVGDEETKKRSWLESLVLPVLELLQCDAPKMRAVWGCPAHTADPFHAGKQWSAVDMTPALLVEDEDEDDTPLDLRLWEWEEPLIARVSYNDDDDDDTASYPIPRHCNDGGHEMHLMDARFLQHERTTAGPPPLLAFRGGIPPSTIVPELELYEYHYPHAIEHVYTYVRLAVITEAVAGGIDFALGNEVNTTTDRPISLVLYGRRDQLYRDAATIEADLQRASAHRRITTAPSYHAECDAGLEVGVPAELARLAREAIERDKDGDSDNDSLEEEES